MAAPGHFKIIGVGGVGTHLVDSLAAQLSFHAPDSVLTLIDGDVFEPKNAERQRFDPKMHGNKASVKARELREGFTNILINDLPCWVVSDGFVATGDEDDPDSTPVGKVPVSDLLDENDWIVLSVDNNDVRRLVFEAARNIANIDIISGGNGTLEDGDALTGSVYHYRRRDGQDVTGSPLFYHEDEYANAHGHNPGEMSCQQRAKLEGGTQLSTSNMCVAMLMMAKFNATYFSGDEAQCNTSLEQTEVFFDLRVMRMGSVACPPPKVTPVAAEGTEQKAETTVLA